jgi:Spy/CpxP family protein refolding chaperone
MRRNSQDTPSTPRNRSLFVRGGMVAAATLLSVAGWAAVQPGAGGGPSFAERGGHRSGEGPGHFQDRRNERLARVLELTDEQIAQWEAAQLAHREATEPLRDQIQANQEALHTLLEDPAADATAVGETMLNGRSLRGEVEAAREALEAQLEALLTPAQLDRYEAIRAAGGERRGRPGAHPRGRGRGRGDRG